ncbi:MAG TPA: hypothetical protein VIV66_23620, partial [Pyrinomonadaceae bacterium]
VQSALREKNYRSALLNAQGQYNTYKLTGVESAIGIIKLAFNRIVPVVVSTVLSTRDSFPSAGGDSSPGITAWVLNALDVAFCLTRGEFLFGNRKGCVDRRRSSDIVVQPSVALTLLRSSISSSPQRVDCSSFILSPSPEQAVFPRDEGGWRSKRPLSVWLYFLQRQKCHTAFTPPLIQTDNI